LREDQLVATRARLQAVAQRVLQQVPGTALASDQFARLYDLAIDYCEDVPHVGETAVQRIVELMLAEGMQAKVSSIHVNGWFGDHDKLSMSRRIAHELFGLDIDAERSRIVYAGDSPNDAPMFAHFDHSVGVANVLDFVDQIDLPPRYVTRSRSGDGFREIAERLLALRAPGTAHLRP
jgi:hydroxymethylpyrimidine pyrophosphatase-like HAD family hydrolase